MACFVTFVSILMLIEVMARVVRNSFRGIFLSVDVMY